MKIQTKEQGIVEIAIGFAGVPVLRLLSFHAPGLRIEAESGGLHCLVPVGEMVLDHDIVVQVNKTTPSSLINEVTPPKSVTVETLNSDRAQLRALSEIHGPIWAPPPGKR